MKPYLPLLVVLLCIFTKAQAQHAVLDANYTNLKYSDQFFYLQTGDINGDGLTDVVAASDQIKLWLQQPGGTLAAPQHLFFNNNGAYVAMNMTIADLDKDGRNELLILNYECLKIYRWESGTLRLTDSIGGVGGGYQMEGLTTADFDGDGYTDIAFPQPGDKRLVIMYYQSESPTNWDIRRYDISRRTTCYLTSGMYGPLTQPAILFLDDTWDYPVSVLTFGSNRQIKQHDSLDMDEPGNGVKGAHSLAVVHKGSKPAELWLTYGGNIPNGKIAVWRGLQPKPDTTFRAGQIPEAIVSANMDCDDDDEPVVLHGGWQYATLYTDTGTTHYYDLPHVSHYTTTAAATGDINNDGRIDVCFITWPYELTILYNITSPCWPAAVPVAAGATSALQVYPNPTTDVLHIGYRGSAAICISNAMGSVVYRGNIQDTAQLPVHNWAAGMYLLKLTDGNGTTITTRVAVQH